jgi:HemY protein
MIWSFVKIVLFVAAVAALTLLAGYLSENGDGVRIAVANMEFNLGPVQAIIIVLLALLFLWIALKLLGLIVAFLKFLNGDETALSRYFDRNRERKGYQALSDALMALASGEARVAMAQAARAEKYLNRPELTNLLTAQAAELSGDTRRATEVYKRLLADDRTRFVGVRGLMKQKLAEGDTGVAFKLAETAYALKPRHEEVQDALLKLQTTRGDWKGARDVLGAKRKLGLLPRDVHQRRDAVLALQEAKEVFDENASIEVREAAIAANRQSPDLIPAAVLAAQSYVMNGKPKLATRLLRKAWEAQPHPDLATAYAAIVPDETAAARLKRFETLMSANPTDEETRLLRAELNIAAEDFPAARRALGNLPESHPTARSLTIMAAITRGEGADDALVRGWLTRALTASRGPKWVCDKCHNVYSEWTPTCDGCGGLDTLSWREPPQSETPANTQGSDMLPLIVGRIASADASEEERAGPSEGGDPNGHDETMIIDEEAARRS